MTLKRYKLASVLNVVGLTLAFVAFYIIASQVWYSVTYNSSIKDADRTYLIQPRFSVTNQENEQWSTLCPQPVSYETLELCPDAETGASLCPTSSIDRVWKKVTDYNFEKFPIEVFYGNANVVDLFGFNCLAGDLKKIAEPNTVIMSRSAAEQIGVGIGEQIWFEGGDWHNDGKPQLPQTVVAIYEDFPRNTFLHKCRIIRNDNLVNGQHNGNWNYSFLVRMSEDADADKFARIWEEQYLKWFASQVAEFKEMFPEEAAEMEGEFDNMKMAVRLVALDDVYYDVRDAEGTIYEAGSRSATAILVAIALVIVIIAFINFVNFFIALIPVRMRAVNICKVFGASQGTLRWNFLFEAIGLVMIAMILAFYLMIVLKDSFVSDYVTCSLALCENLPVIMIMFALMLLLAVVTALYPAFYITRFNASFGVKGGFAQSATGRRLRSVMIGVQFTVAMVLIIVTAVFFMQYRFMAKYDMGFDRENIVAFYSGNIGNKDEVLIERLLQHPDAIDATNSRFNIFHAGTTWGRFYEGKDYLLKPNKVRYNFLDFFGFEIVEGNGFTPTSAERDEMVIMRSFNREIGIPIGYHFTDGFDVTGVMKDVRLSAAGFKPLEYYAFICSNEWGSNYNYYVRIGANTDVKAFAKYVNELCKEFNPNGDDVEIFFLDEYVQSMYKDTRRQTIIIGLFAVLAIVIALMGVFGIVLFETQHRRREIGIRKVYGATTENVVMMFVRRYGIIVGLCFVVAAPVAWYVSSRWLEQFANRISMPIWVYVSVLLIVLAITILLVAIRSLKAARENPVEAI